MIAEYVAFRELQHRQGGTSYHVLRQIRRVVKFWQEYLGGYDVEAIGNKQLSGYVEWRKPTFAFAPGADIDAALYGFRADKFLRFFLSALPQEAPEQQQKLACPLEGVLRPQVYFP